MLGLVADPPTTKYVYKPDVRSEAIIAGRRVLDKYNCGACHILNSEKWHLSIPESAVNAPPEVKTFPFMVTQETTDRLETSAAVDRRGRVQATISGAPTLSQADGIPQVVDSENEPLIDDEPYDPSRVRYSVDLWETALVGGHVREVSQVVAGIQPDWIDKKRDAHGGYLARYLIPKLVARQKAGAPLLNRVANPNANGREAWGWVPPPLLGQGRKVQTEWMFEFLLDPHPIRPLVVLRMPKFNMSEAEAKALVNYFAAIDGVEYPYSFASRRRGNHLQDAEQRYRQIAAGNAVGTRLDAAMKVVTDGRNGCTQCHAVGDYAEAPKGPNLEMIYRRLRPDYVRRWIARPVSILPYTSMPENVKYNPADPAQDGIVFKAGDKTLKYIHGSSTEQLDALVDLLMNWDQYMQQQTSVRELVKKNTPPPPAGGTAAEDSNEAE